MSSMTTKRALFLIGMLCAAFTTWAQSITVTGTVIGADDQLPLPGVNVVVEGTAIGTSTDFDGNFSIAAEKGQNLSFSFMGYRTTTKAVVGATMNIFLEVDSEQLDEVVVTALGIKRETKALGYAVTEVKGEGIAASTTVSPIEALTGKVAGVNIGASDGGTFGGSKIEIRGASTFGGNNQPIFVVDGVIMDNETSSVGSADWNGSGGDWGNELKNLNPDDFESVSVLKGAAATALYGSRALNGAIIITTKSGKKRDGVGVTVNQTVAVDKVYRAGVDMQTEYGPGNYYGNRAGYSTNPYANELARGVIDGQQYFSIADVNTNRMFGPKYDPSMEVINFDGELAPFQAFQNGLVNAYDLGVRNNTNVSLNGGSDRTTYYTSMSYNKTTGVTRNNDFSRISLMGKASHKFTDWLKGSFSMNYTRSNPTNPAVNYIDNYVNGYWSPAYDIEKFSGDSKYYQAPHGGTINRNNGDAYADVPHSAYWWNLENRQQSRVENVFRPTFDLDFTINDNWNLTLGGNLNHYTYLQETKNLGSGINNTGRGNGAAGQYKMQHYEKMQHTLKAVARYSNTFGDFDINGFLGAETFSTGWSQTAAWTNNGLIAPGQFFIGNSQDLPGTTGSIGGTKTINSIYGSISAAWRNQFYLDVTGRNDWSSALVYSNGTGNHSYFYPSLSGSWVISETFHEDLPEWVDFGKVRVSWAQVGSDTNPYTINSAYGQSRLIQENIYMHIPNATLIPDNLRPQRKNAFEVGTDWNFFLNRLGFGVTYYKENTFDQIMNIAVPYASGAKNRLINAGNIQNHGIEIELHATPVKVGDFSWDMDFTFTRNRNKIISLYEGVDRLVLSGNPSYGNYRVAAIAEIGGDYGALYSDSAPKQYQGENAANHGMTELNYYGGTIHAAYAKRSGELTKVGKIAPDLLSSFNTSLRYKRWTASALFNMRWGGHIASFTNRYGQAYGLTEASMQYRDIENGGFEWTSGRDGAVDAAGNQLRFQNGMIPEGVFADGTKVTAPNGNTVNVGGMSYREAYESGHVEPLPAGVYHYWNNSWGGGTVNDNWVSEVKYISIEEVRLAYSFDPNMFNGKIENLSISAYGRNLGYIYNSLPNNLNPKSIRGNSSSSFMERSPVPYTATFGGSVKISF